MLAKSIGGITRLAERLGKTQSQISHLIGNNPVKNIGDKIAKETEVAFKKAPGWLDHEHGEVDSELRFYPVGNYNDGVLCAQVPLITWQEAKHWHQIAYSYKPHAASVMVPTTVKVGPLAFAIYVYGDSMEAPTGLSFPHNAIIIADPDEVAKPNSFVIATINQSRGATFKQLIKQGHQRYLKPLNPRYPIIEFTPTTIIVGVIKQMVINFQHSNIKNNLIAQKSLVGLNKKSEEPENV
jgi:SOS-response transcriptional repressor LexA